MDTQKLYAKLKRIRLTKDIVGGVVAFCTGALVRAMADENLPDDMTPLQKVAVNIGVFAVAGAAGAAVAESMMETTGEILGEQAVIREIQRDYQERAVAEQPEEE